MNALEGMKEGEAIDIHQVAAVFSIQGFTQVHITCPPY